MRLRELLAGNRQLAAELAELEGKLAIHNQAGGNSGASDLEPMNRSSFLPALSLFAVAIPLSAAAIRTPVVLDTDIGTDIDDALALLKSGATVSATPLPSVSATHDSMPE